MCCHSGISCGPRYGADLPLCYPLMLKVTLKYTTTNFKVLGLTRLKNNFPVICQRLQWVEHSSTKINFSYLSNLVNKFFVHHKMGKYIYLSNIENHFCFWFVLCLMFSLFNIVTGYEFICFLFHVTNMSV